MLVLQWGSLSATCSRPPKCLRKASTFTDGRPSQRCTASHDLGGQLSAFSSFIAKREISLAQRSKEFPRQLGVLDIRTVGIAEPQTPMMVFTNRDRTSVAFILDGYAAEVTIPLAAFAKLEQGCAVL